MGVMDTPYLIPAAEIDGDTAPATGLPAQRATGDGAACPPSGNTVIRGESLSNQPTHTLISKQGKSVLSAPLDSLLGFVISFQYHQMDCIRMPPLLII